MSLEHLVQLSDFELKNHPYSVELFIVNKSLMCLTAQAHKTK